jgi:hypothetical protein
LRKQVEELRGGVAAEPDSVEPPPEVNTLAEPAVPAASVATPAPSSSVWQRIERLPRNRLDTALLVLGALAVVYAGLWQIALALGFS